MKNALLSIALVGLLVVPALAAPPTSAYNGQAATDNENRYSTEFGTRTLDPLVYSEVDASGFYLPGAAGTSTNREWGDDIHTSFSTHDLVGGSGDNFIMSGFGVSWFINSTTGAGGASLIATVRFYANDAADSTFTGIPLASYNFTDPNLIPGRRDTIVKIDDVLMPADLWMTVQFAFANGATPITRKPGILIAGDWPRNPFNDPTGGTAAEVGHSDWWFLTDAPSLSYFGSPVGGAPPGNFVFDVYGRAVPEPVTMGLLALSGLALIRRRR